MERFLARSAIDSRFVDLVFLMCLGVWPWLMLGTIGIVVYAWKFVLMCQAIALPFSVLGWSAGFQAGQRNGFGQRGSAMIAGWVGLLTAEVGLGIVLWPWFGSGGFGPGLLAFPALAVLVTLGVLFLYRTGTWPNDAATRRGNGA